MNGPCENTDKEIWRAIADDYYAPSIHVTEEEGIGINVGGTVIVKPIGEWHRLAIEELNRRAPDARQILIEAKKAVISAACGICALSEAGLLKRLEELYLRGVKAAVDITIKDHSLYHRLNEMLAILGADGEIDTRHPKVTAVMDCLHNIDNGMYQPQAQADQQAVIDNLAMMMRRLIHAARGIKESSALQNISEQALDLLGRYSLSGNTLRDMVARTQAQAGPVAVDFDSIALEAAQEIALMWGHDRSQFVSKIQCRVIEAMEAVKHPIPAAPTEPVATVEEEHPFRVSWIRCPLPKGTLLYTSSIPVASAVQERNIIIKSDEYLIRFLPDEKCEIILLKVNAAPKPEQS